jgi:hypothetical protein
MESLIGWQLFSAPGYVVPTGTPLRLFSVDFHSTVSATQLTFHDALVSSTTTTIKMRVASDSQGTAHEDFNDGRYFANGIWIDTGAAGTVTFLIGYSKVTA